MPLAAAVAGPLFGRSLGIPRTLHGRRAQLHSARAPVLLRRSPCTSGWGRGRSHINELSLSTSRVPRRVATTGNYLELAEVAAMVQPLSWILWNSAMMFVGAFGAGMLPLVVKVGENRLKLMNMVGAGLMVGTALAVIIPEGADAFYGAYHGEDEAPSGVLGLSLLGGFLLMLAVDAVKFTSGPPTAQRTSADAESLVACLRQTSDANAERPISEMPGFSALLGILVHSGADGIALGAAAFSSHEATGALISLAIIAHKAPTAFALSTFMLNSGWSWRQVRQGTFLFALAAPLVAMLGYVLIGAVPIFSSPSGVAVCLLLSGGTFLYAACIHILPEAMQTSQVHGHHGDAKLTAVQVAAISFGAVIPLIFSMYHSHDHGGGAMDHAHSHGVAEHAAHEHSHHHHRD